LETAVGVVVLTLLVQFLTNQWLAYFNLAEINVWQAFGILFLPTYLSFHIKTVIKR
jgi:hypothetical protein